jgi:hypothetical protein
MYLVVGIRSDYNTNCLNQSDSHQGTNEIGHLQNHKHREWKMLRGERGQFEKAMA